MEKPDFPLILAPAGDEASFLAALAAGADAIYVGLKQFSARMAAKNFDLASLARLCGLAARHNCRVEVAFNNMLREVELEEAWRMLRGLVINVPVSGLIVQDLAMLELSRQAGFKGSLTLSTLGALTSPAGLAGAASLGFDRVVLPRELSIDEMRLMAMACPTELELECFVHGALCYSVSGRCWWSSYMGGKSGLRGQCVQPCRRLYSKTVSGKAREGRRFFACQDLQLGELVKLLLDLPQIGVWKIEGRKKGPHYVYHAVTAYKILRDNPGDAQKKKLAIEILDAALGRPGVKARFLPRANRVPMAPDKPTGSGRLAARARIEAGGKVAIRPMFDLLKRDYLRVGSQDERWHALVQVNRPVPKGGTFFLNLPKHKTPANGTPVFLVDRREPELERLLAELRKELDSLPLAALRQEEGKPRMPKPCKPRRETDMALMPRCQKPENAKNFTGCLKGKAMAAIWLAPGKGISRSASKMAIWLPPQIWPEQEENFARAIRELLVKGVKCFVCNSPWQIALFPKGDSSLNLIAGPFCNIANALALEELRKMGYKAAFASPELPRGDIIALPHSSPLPLGFTLAGFWPVSLSRFGLAGIDANEVFSSPRGEQFWARNYGGTIWIYPAWPLDLCAKLPLLEKAGYSFFATMDEKAPEALAGKRRPGLFNWDVQLA